MPLEFRDAEDAVHQKDSLDGTDPSVGLGETSDPQEESRLFAHPQSVVQGVEPGSVQPAIADVCVHVLVRYGTISQLGERLSVEVDHPVRVLGREVVIEPTGFFFGRHRDHPLP